MLMDCRYASMPCQLVLIYAAFTYRTLQTAQLCCTPVLMLLTSASYVSGSMNMSYDSSNLTTPDIKWLGVRPSDLDRFNIPEQCRLPMTEEDLKTGKRLVCYILHS